MNYFYVQHKNNEDGYKINFGKRRDQQFTNAIN